MNDDLIEALAKRLHDAYWIESAGHAFELGELDRRDPEIWRAYKRLWYQKNKEKH